MSFRITHLFVYPIKACQGVRLDESRATPGGLALDRAFCVVDRSGARYRKNEQLSQRKLPCLASIKVKLSEDGGTVTVSSALQPAHGSISFPTDASAYAAGEKLIVECGAKSTTSSGAWQLGTMVGRVASASVNAWLSAVLNAGDSALKRKKPEADYALVRSFDPRLLHRYAGPQQAPYDADVEKQRTGEASPFKMESVPVRATDAVRFADFSPYLLTSEASLAALTKAMGLPAGSYPMAAFRPNIVVRGDAPWAEESWRRLRFVSGKSSGSVGPSFRFLKLAPRCTVPARNQRTGGWNLPEKGKKLLFSKTLRKMFPEKCVDDEWGPEWEGAMFGAHVALDADDGGDGTTTTTAILRVGDAVEVMKRETKKGGRNAKGCRQGAMQQAVPLVVAALAVLLIVLFVVVSFFQPQQGVAAGNSGAGRDGL